MRKVIGQTWLVVALNNDKSYIFARFNSINILYTGSNAFVSKFLLVVYRLTSLSLSNVAYRVFRVTAHDGTTRKGRQFVCVKMVQMYFIIHRFLDRRTIATSSARNAEITLTVDGKEVTVPQGTAQPLVFLQMVSIINF